VVHLQGEVNGAGDTDKGREYNWGGRICVGQQEGEDSDTSSRKKAR